MSASGMRLFLESRGGGLPRGAKRVSVEFGSSYRDAKTLSVVEVAKAMAVNDAVDLIFHGKDDDDLFGFAWSSTGQLPKQGDAWFWPLRKGHRFSGDDFMKPRYRSPADALIKSLVMNGGTAAVVAAQGPGFGRRQVDGSVDLIGYEGPVSALKKWWVSGLQKVKTAAPVKWRGSDDPMTL